jgi:hypothetical protein
VDLNPGPARFAGWIPIGLYWRGTQLMVDWCHAGDARFTDPFFEQSISNLVQRPFNLLFRHQTSIDDLPALNAALPGLKVAGFIFHLSRCGSTVISRMLAALPQNLVLSEPRLLDFVLRAHPRPAGISEEQRIFRLRSLIGALGQQRRPEQTHCLIKFDCWHTLHLPLIRRAFPGVPWLFVYREPVEVLVSHQRQPAAQMMPGLIDPRLLGLDPQTLGPMPGDEYCARVLSAISQAALAQGRGSALFINYRHLPGIVFSSILPFFNVPCAAGEAESLREVARSNAKEPSLPFTPDSAAKQQEAGERLRQLSDRLLRPWYDQMEACCAC